MTSPLRNLWQPLFEFKPFEYGIHCLLPYVFTVGGAVWLLNGETSYVLECEPSLIWHVAWQVATAVGLMGLLGLSAILLYTSSARDPRLKGHPVLAIAFALLMTGPLFAADGYFLWAALRWYRP